MNKLCKVPHKRKFHEAPCHKPDSEKVIITGKTIDSKKLKLVHEDAYNKRYEHF